MTIFANNLIKKHYSRVMKKITKRVFVILFLSSALFSLNAEIRMPVIFGDNMVLQQQSKAAI